MKKLLFSLSILLATTVAMSAQNFRTGYFLDGYMYKYQLNPAFQGERGFIALPALGGTSLGVESNLSAGTFVYTVDDQLVSFMNSGVSNETFMKNIKTNNPLNVNLDLNLFALGFRAKNTYHTLDFSFKGNLTTSLPGDTFRFIKVGRSDGNPVFDFSSLYTNATIYSQLAYGFSIKIKDFMSFGLRAKFLMGHQTIQSKFDSFKLTLQPEKWAFSLSGNMYATPLGGDFSNGTGSAISSMLSTANLGGAIDFGVSFDITKNITISASVLDLGFISWNDTNNLSINSIDWKYNSFDASDEDGLIVIQEFANLLDQFATAFDFQRHGEAPAHIQKLGCTAILGLELRLPFYNRITLGALGVRKFEGPASWSEQRVSLNYAPFRWFSLAGSYAFSTYGHSYGAAVNIHPKGFNLFVGLDSFKPLLNMTPNYIPIDEINTNLKFGLTFPFGKYNGRYPKKEKIGQE